MDILVTGGAGFVGSNLVDALLENDFKVKAFDNLSTGRMENLAGASKNKNFGFIKGDVRDFDAKILDGIDAVFNEAAQIDVRKSVSDPKYDLDVNVGGTINLLESMRKYDVGKIVYASSGGAIYGNPQYLPCDEEHPTNPISPYGASKLAAEKYIGIYHETYGIDYVNLRYGNVYGPRQDPLGEAGVIAIFLNKILNGQKPVIFGDGSQTRDYVHVYDVVAGNLLAMDKLNNGSFNVGCGSETSVNRLVEIISELTGGKITPKHAEERKGEVQRICLDISRIKKVGFKPRYDLKEGMKTVLDWINNKNKQK